MRVGLACGFRSVILLILRQRRLGCGVPFTAGFAAQIALRLERFLNLAGTFAVGLGLALGNSLAARRRLRAGLAGGSGFLLGRGTLLGGRLLGGRFRAGSSRGGFRLRNPPHGRDQNRGEKNPSHGYGNCPAKKYVEVRLPGPRRITLNATSSPDFSVFWMLRTSSVFLIILRLISRITSPR